MSRSFGLTAYRALSRRTDVTRYDAQTARPEGEVLWIHAPSGDNLLALQDLAARSMQTRPGLAVVMTPCASAGLADAMPRPNLILAPCPSEHPSAASAFIEHWAPDTCLWSWGDLRPNVIDAAAKAGCPIHLIDADAGGFDGRRDRWLPDVARGILPVFSSLSVRNESAARRLRQLGARADNIRIASPLLAGGAALTCNETDLTEMSAALAGRPVWLACNLQPSEIDIVLAAHQKALRQSHRLLLILNTHDASQIGQAKDAASHLGLRQQDWDADGFPEEHHQVLQVSDRAEVGLFYRVAPVSYLGGSMSGKADACDPMEAAALGSAILYGPKVGRFLPSYSRLVSAGAARIVNDAAALGIAVSRLIAPDQAAAMAHAGWDVISEGAEQMDTLVELVQDSLDTRRGSDQRHANT